MKGHRSWAFICAFALLAACKLPPDVPEDARLLYYGPVNDSKQINDILSSDEINDSPHQVYVYDDEAGKVVEVRTIDAKHRELNISWLPGHRYRVYIY
jgi:hypothetical protein